MNSLVNDGELPYAAMGVPLKRDALVALGAIACLWGQIESATEVLVWALAGMLREEDDENIENRILTNRINTPTKVQIIESLVRHHGIWDEELGKAIRESLKEVRGLAAQRNEFFHAPEWYADTRSSPVTSYAIRSKRGGETGFRSDPIPFDRATYEAMIERMNACRSDLWNLVAHAEWLHT